MRTRIPFSAELTIREDDGAIILFSFLLRSECVLSDRKRLCSCYCVRCYSLCCLDHKVPLDGGGFSDRYGGRLTHLRGLRMSWGWLLGSNLDGLAENNPTLPNLQIFSEIQVVRRRRLLIKSFLLIRPRVAAAIYCLTLFFSIARQGTMPAVVSFVFCSLSAIHIHRQAFEYT